jgi:hypothetical protein
MAQRQPGVPAADAPHVQLIFFPLRNDSDHAPD